MGPTKYSRRRDRLAPMLKATFPRSNGVRRFGGNRTASSSLGVTSIGQHGSNTSIADEQLSKRLREIPRAFLEFETGLSRHTIVRARRGQPVRVWLLTVTVVGLDLDRVSHLGEQMSAEQPRPSADTRVSPSFHSGRNQD